MDVLVAGASGFVGRRLCPALEEAGHVVRAMTRHPDDYQGVGEPVQLRQIVYLGGLGRDEDELSPHLRSRREVERLLGHAGVPVTTLRAGIIVGHGGISWEMTRQLVEHLPAMITPRWVHTKTRRLSGRRSGVSVG